MAPRTKLPDSPALDDTPKEADKRTRSGAMTEYGFNSLIRGVFNAPRNRIEQLRQVVDTHKKRLGVKRGRRVKPVTELPEGSDQLDIQSINWWAGKIEKGDKPAISQLRVLDATLATRAGG